MHRSHSNLHQNIFIIFVSVRIVHLISISYVKQITICFQITIDILPINNNLTFISHVIHYQSILFSNTAVKPFETCTIIKHTNPPQIKQKHHNISFVLLNLTFNLSYYHINHHNITNYRKLTSKTH